MKSNERADITLQTRIAELEMLLKRTDILFSIAEACIKSTNLAELLKLIVETIAQGIEANRVSMIIPNLAEQKIDHFVRGGPGVGKIDLSVTYDELMEGLSGWAILNKSSALSPKDKPDSRESEIVQQRRRATNCGAIVVTPVQYQGQVLGTITVINQPEDRNFTARDVQLIEAAASWAASAIVKASLYEELEKVNRTLRDHELELKNEIAERDRIAHQLKASEDKFRLLVELAPDALLITNDQGEISFTNVLCQNMFGYASNELLHQPVEILLPERFHQIHRIHRDTFNKNPLQRFMGASGTSELFGRKKDGTEFPVEVSLSPLQLTDSLVIMAGINDITMRKQLESENSHRASQLEALNRLGRKIISTFELDEIYTFAHETTEQLMAVDAFQISLVNEQENIAEDVYLFDKGKRYPNERISLSTSSITTHVINHKQTLIIKDDAEGVAKSIGYSLFGSSDDTRSIVMVPMIEKEKVIGVISVQHYQPNMYTSSHAQLLELLASQVAVAILNARLHINLQRDAVRDPLTGLFNRRFMEEALEKEIMRAKRNTEPLALAFLDLDHFKRINDRFGHDAGDLVLRLLGKMIEDKTRSSDVACRYGGEEFALILPGATADHAWQRMEQFRLELRHLPFSYQEKTMIPITCSIGISAYPEHGLTKELLLKSADQALYRAKKNGRNQVLKAE